MALTDSQLRNAKSKEKLYYLYDEKRLCAEVPPNGQIRWRMKYTIDGKEKRISLGTYPEVSLKDAREKRDDMRKMVANGVDPGMHRKGVKTSRADNAANSFEVIARERIAKFSQEWVLNHKKKVVSRLENDLIPYLGGYAITEITPQQILMTVRKIEARGALETAHRALGDCGQIFRYAVATCRAERDPTQDLKGALPPYKGKHFAAVTEPKPLAPLLRLLDGYPSIVVGSALRLMPLLFLRPIELRTALWKDINLDDAEWRFTVTKTNTPHIVPLARQAVEILRELKLHTGNGPHVFPNGRDKNKPMSDNAVLTAMRSIGITKEETTGHGFRATARTIADEILGIRPDFMEHQLAHTVKDPNGRAYNRTAHLAQRKVMMQAWADYLDELKKF